jgi:hypothetical protein
LEVFAEVQGQWRAKLDPGAGAWLCEANLGSVEKIAGQRRQHDFANAKLRCCAVQRVTDDRMAQSRKMHADLVCAAGVKLNCEQRGSINWREDAPVGAGFAGVAKDDAAAGGHAGTALGIAGDGQIDRPVLLFHKALHQGDVDFLDLALAEGFAELGVRGVVFGDQDDAGSIFVEAMHDAGAKSVAALRECLAAAKQGVDQRAAGGTRAGMHGHAGGLVDRDDVRVFVKDVERNGFRLGAERRARLDLDGDALAAPEPIRAFGGTGVDEHQARGYEFLHSATTDAADASGYELIEALSSITFTRD